MMKVDAAVELHRHLMAAADELSADSAVVTDLVDEASGLLGQTLANVGHDIKRLAGRMRSIADDLDDRIRLVALGGPDMNAGLAALEHLRNHFKLIETRGDPSRADGKLSRRDLEWARSEVPGPAGDAAAWLLANRDFFDKVETAKYNRRYLDRSYEGVFHHDEANEDGLMSLEDIDAFVTKSTAWTALLPHLAAIDGAASGGGKGAAGGSGDGEGGTDGVLSREDFEALMAGYRLPPDVDRAVKQVLADRAYHRPDGGGVVSLGTALDLLSFVPVVGDLVDAGRSLYYVLNGDYVTAAIFALGLAPIPGLSGSGLRHSVRVVESITGAALGGGSKAGMAKAKQEVITDTMQTWRANEAADFVLEKTGEDEGWLGELNQVISSRMSKQFMLR